MVAPHHESPDAVAIGRELAARLREALAELPQREAQVFCLRCFEDLSYKEIGDSLDISPNAAAVALHKARAKLELLLSDAPKGE
jgi:RNA polymerase sigma-70 factor (ECF subfamily)